MKSRNLFSRLFLKHFSKYLLLLSSFAFLFFIIISNEVHLFDRGPKNATAQEEYIASDPIYPAEEEYIASDPIYPAAEPEYIASDPIYPQPEAQYIAGDPIYPQPEPQYIASDPIYPQQPTYTESAGCNGRHSVWGKWNGSTLIEVEADYGEVPGQCGVSAASSNYSPSYSSSNSGSWQFAYPECDWNSGQVYDVYWHSGTGEYDRRDYHYQSGVCGYNQSSGSTNYSQSGSWEFKYPECDWNSRQVVDVYQHTGTGAYERRNPHYQEDACGYNQEYEGPGCNGNRSVWGIWTGSNRQTLKRVERDYGVVPGECNNPYPTQRPVAIVTPQRTYQDRQECDGRKLIVRRYWSDNRTEIVTQYGEYVGYCGVSQQVVTQQTPTYTAPTYTAPAYTAPTYTQPVVQQPQPVGVYNPVVSVPQIQASCTANTHQILVGQAVTYQAHVRTGGTGQVGRVDFRGEQSQSSNTPSFTVVYNTPGMKYMSATVYDADSRAGSQFVACPGIYVDRPTVGGTPIVTQPTVNQPVYTQPTYYAPQVGTPVFYQNPAPAAPPTVVYGNAPQTNYQMVSSVNYCPSGHQQQIVGNTVYCLVYTQANSAPQTIAYTYSGNGVITTQQVQGQGAVTPSVTPTTAPSTSSIQCPAGYAAQAVGSSVYCVATQQTTSSAVQPKQTVVVPAAAGPQVVTQTPANITELPKTGLPLFAWGISALLPLGVKMRKVKRESESSDVSANSIWMERELKR